MTTQSTKISTGNHKSIVIAWLAIPLNGDGESIPFCQYTDKSAQVTGTFGGATVQIEGSNNGADWATLTDPQGNSLSFTGPKIEMVAEATYLVRPKVTGGDGTTSINVHLLIKE